MRKDALCRLQFCVRVRACVYVFFVGIARVNRLANEQRVCAFFTSIAGAIRLPTEKTLAFSGGKTPTHSQVSGPFGGCFSKCVCVCVCVCCVVWWWQRPRESVDQKVEEAASFSAGRGMWRVPWFSRRYF